MELRDSRRALMEPAIPFFLNVHSFVPLSSSSFHRSVSWIFFLIDKGTGIVIRVLNDSDIMYVIAMFA